jgi:hypothetical protein
LEKVTRSFSVEGPDGLGAKPKPQLIGPILATLHGSLQDSVRMGFLHSSRPKGRVRGTLKNAADVRFVGFNGRGGDATELFFEVPILGDVAPEFFAQSTLWEDFGPRSTDTAFELFGAALNDIGDKRADSSRYDPPFLRRIANYNSVLKRGVARVSMPDVDLPHGAQINASVVRAANELAVVTPSSHRVRIAGRLDLMGASQGVLKVEVNSGEVVTALWDGEDPIEKLRELFNRDVVVEGLAVFRPSGSLLRIDADEVVLASVQDDFFRHVPTAAVVKDFAKIARLKPGDRSAYRQLRGSMPAEESDAEFEAALASLR